MDRRPALVLALMLSGAGAWAAPGAPITSARYAPPSRESAVIDPRPPAQVQARGRIEPTVFTVHWDSYRTLIAVDDGAGLVRSAWVVTRESDSLELVVAYRALAYLDRDGVLRIDSRQAYVDGPQAFKNGRKNWWPDSFSLTKDGQALIIDEQPQAQGHLGKVEAQIPQAQQPDTYREQRDWARTLVQGEL